MGSLRFTHKLYLAAFILGFFFVFLFAFAGFFLIHYCYGRLAKYFLDNVYRIKGAFSLMTLVYGVRPFLKGIIHALLSRHNTQSCASCHQHAFEFFGGIFLNLQCRSDAAIIIIGTANRDINNLQILAG